MDRRIFPLSAWWIPFLVLMLFPAPMAGLTGSVHAADCVPTVSGNVYTVNETCTFANPIDGVDHGTGTVNDAQLRVASLGNITLGNTQQLGLGSLVMDGGTIHLPTGATIRIATPLYAPDADGDGIPDAAASFTGTTRYGSVARPLTGGQYDCYAGSGLYSYVTSGSAPVGYWRLDEPGGTVRATDSAGANLALSTSSTNVTSGQSGISGDNARTFDGTQYLAVKTPDVSAFDFEYSDPFTIEAWINTSAAATTMNIFSKMTNGSPYAGYELYTTATGTLAFYAINTWSSAAIQKVGSLPVANGQWHHVAVSYSGSGDAAGITLYVDGAVDSGTVTVNNLGGASIRTTTPPYIGSRGGSAVKAFVGTIDDVRVYNYQRTGTQIHDEDMPKYSPSVRMYAGDSDGDGYGYNDAAGVTTCALQAGYGPRTGDTAPSDATVFQTATAATDADADRFTTASPGPVSVGYAAKNLTTGLTYYSTDGGTTYTYLAGGSQSGTADCNDSPSAGGQYVMYPITSCYYDADGDGAAGTSPVTRTCMDKSTCAASVYGTTGGSNDLATYSVGRWVTSKTDCNDGNANVKNSHAQCYLDADGDTYTAGLAANTTCLSATTCAASTYASASVDGAADGGYRSPGYYRDGANGSDCNDNPSYTNANQVWSATSCYVDADGDGYTNGTKNCTNNAVCTSATYGSTANTNDVTYYPLGMKSTTSGADCDDRGTGYNSQFVFLSNTCYIDVDYDLYPRNCSQTSPTDAYCDASNRWVYTCVNTGSCNTATYGNYAGHTVYGYTAGQLRSSAEIKTSPVYDADDTNGAAY